MSEGNNSGDLEVELLEVSAVTPHNRALYEAGKKMLSDSLSIGADFCKSMISTSSGAIAVYLGFFVYVLPKDYRIPWPDNLLVLGPAIGFLISSLIFALGYFPRTGKFSLDIPEQIDKARRETITKRAKLARCGFGTFLLSTLGAIGVIVWVATAYQSAR